LARGRDLDEGENAAVSWSFWKKVQFFFYSSRKALYEGCLVGHRDLLFCAEGRQPLSAVARPLEAYSEHPLRLGLPRDLRTLYSRLADPAFGEWIPRYEDPTWFLPRKVLPLGPLALFPPPPPTVNSMRLGARLCWTG